MVHINAGIAGLAAALALGKRIGYGKEPMPPHNLTFTVIGASLLWVGWFVSFVILKVIDATIGLRVSEDQEREGLDIALHGEHVE